MELAEYEAGEELAAYDGLESAGEGLELTGEGVAVYEGLELAGGGAVELVGVGPGLDAYGGLELTGEGVTPEAGLVTGGGLTTGCVGGLTADEGVTTGVVALDADVAGVAALDAKGLRTPRAKVSTRLTTKRLVRGRPMRSPLAAVWEQRLLEVLRSDMLTLSAARAAAIAVAIVSGPGGLSGPTRPAG